MELPASVRQAIDAGLAHVPLEALSAAAQALSDRYRSEVRDGRLHVSDDMAACAYLAARLPATYAAISAVFEAVAEMRPDFAPQSLLDIGAGPGTALLAATQVWPVSDALLIERSGAIRSWGEQLAPLSHAERIVWKNADLARDSLQRGTHDLVVIAYVLNELEPAATDRLIAQGWAASNDMMVIVEPGTPAGWRRILKTREQLLAAGAHALAPCPHAQACPLIAPDWCHFSRKVARTRLHRLIKGADVPWEDEKFIYFAASRRPVPAVAGRIVASPKRGGGRVGLKLCHSDGTAGEQLFTRRQADAFKIARRLDWGDALPRHRNDSPEAAS